MSSALTSIRITTKKEKPTPASPPMAMMLDQLIEQLTKAQNTSLAKMVQQLCPEYEAVEKKPNGYVRIDLGKIDQGSRMGFIAFVSDCVKRNSSDAAASKPLSSSSPSNRLEREYEMLVAHHQAHLHEHKHCDVTFNKMLQKERTKLGSNGNSGGRGKRCRDDLEIDARNNLNNVNNELVDVKAKLRQLQKMFSGYLTNERKRLRKEIDRLDREELVEDDTSEQPSSPRMDYRKFIRCIPFDDPDGLSPCCECKNPGIICKIECTKCTTHQGLCESCSNDRSKLERLSAEFGCNCESTSNAADEDSDSDENDSASQPESE